MQEGCKENSGDEQNVNEQSKEEKAAQSQSTLVYLLFALHILFGITALIGVIICHTKKSTTANTVYHSHRIWQLWTFWTGAIGYTAGVYYWLTMGSVNILVLTFGWIYYRIIKGWWKCKKQQTVAIRAFD